jgi:hypothetical protein
MSENLPFEPLNQDSNMIRRVDVLRVHDYARTHCDLRDYLMVRTPLYTGLRTGELCTLGIEDINFEDRTFLVLDSKRKQVYPLPLDPVTLDLLKEFIGDRTKGYVFTHEFDSSWKNQKKGVPLTVSTVWCRIRRIAQQAGVEGFNPRKFRQYFAAMWILEERPIQTLQKILRHKSEEYCYWYGSHFMFWEDLQADYDRIQDGPFVGNATIPSVQSGMTQPLVNETCVTCGSLEVCRFVDKMPENAVGCKYKTPQKIIEPLAAIA